MNANVSGGGDVFLVVPCRTTTTLRAILTMERTSLQIATTTWTAKRHTEGVPTKASIEVDNLKKKKKKSVGYVYLFIIYFVLTFTLKDTLRLRTNVNKESQTMVVLIIIYSK